MKCYVGLDIARNGTSAAFIHDGDGAGSLKIHLMYWSFKKVPDLSGLPHPVDWPTTWDVSIEGFKLGRGTVVVPSEVVAAIMDRLAAMARPADALPPGAGISHATVCLEDDISEMISQDIRTLISKVSSVRKGRGRLSTFYKSVPGYLRLMHQVSVANGRGRRGHGSHGKTSDTLRSVVTQPVNLAHSRMFRSFRGELIRQASEELPARFVSLGFARPKQIAAFWNRGFRFEGRLIGGWAGVERSVRVSGLSGGATDILCRLRKRQLSPQYALDYFKRGLSPKDKSYLVWRMRGLPDLRAVFGYAAHPTSDLLDALIIGLYFRSRNLVAE